MPAAPSTPPAPPAPAQSPDARVAAIRRFSRFYTRWAGALDEGYLDSPFSLAEVRVLYELAHRDAPTSTELRRELQLDAGYLSRLLSSLERRRLVRRVKSSADARRTHLQLTPKGAAEFERVSARTSRDVARLIHPLGDAEQRRLVEAMRTIETLLDTGARAEGDDRRPPYILRPPDIGDYGWIVERHGVLYAREFGWDERFEALVAGIIAEFVNHFDPSRERCWIAERDGERVGSVFLCRHPEREAVARLRLLLVEPSARGLGIGRRLVEECVRFARSRGYRTITLWTNSVLTSARRIYEQTGFTLVSEQPHRMFGPELVGQTWELAL
jgi:DNA-binding MarR family transcriptional regulator/GNAT superfamily N-acetyltransferase